MKPVLSVTSAGAAVLAALVIVMAALAGNETPQRRLYVPVVAGGRPASLDCSIPGQNYISMSISGPAVGVDPDQDPNLNLGVRGYAQVDAPLELVQLGPVHDVKAPQLPGLFADRRTPDFTATYQRYKWDYDCDCRVGLESPWDATVLGMKTARGERIYTPDSGYDIGGGYEYLVLYAGEERITLHIGRQDDLFGYVVHIEEVCVDPKLVSLYRALHAAGRDELPALRGHDPFGVARGDEVRVAVRDTGHFLDPRSRNDWWQGR
jgi:hypothetical protein